LCRGGKELLKNRYALSLLIAGIVFTLDQISKSLVRELLPLNHSLVVVQGFLNLVHIQNPGMIFGIFSQSTYTLKSYLLIIVSLAAITFLFFLLRSLKEKNLFFTIALSLTLGGAIGNLVDRIVLGKVVDFIDVYWSTYHWPAFNVADSAISIGMVILVIQVLRDENN
jgi:signal peptidase II